MRCTPSVFVVQTKLIQLHHWLESISNHRLFVIIANNQLLYAIYFSKYYRRMTADIAEAIQSKCWMPNITNRIARSNKSKVCFDLSCYCCIEG
jgi:hypothetical protein